jgi:Mg-chelatase subunit ChlD
VTKRKEINAFNIAFLDLLSGALGAVIILYIAVPKASQQSKIPAPIPRIPIKESSLSLATTEKELQDTKKTLDSFQQYSQKLELMVETLKKENENLQAKATSLMAKPTTQESTAPVDVGFKFKGKYVVFVIDVSGSMKSEDRIGQVKAGLKMLITSMEKNFYIDVINFPDGTKSEFRQLWGHMKQMDESNKKSVYRFLQDLVPYGATPTRVVLKHVLQNYPHATDIVLLSDGAPTIHNSKQFEDIDQVLAEVQSYNGGRVQINTIGVGSDFIENKQNPKYQFLHRLSQQNHGFFVGF